MKKLIVIAVVICSAIVIGKASAFFGAPYWTVDTANETVYNSKWADFNNIVDLDCQGSGKNHIDQTVGDPDLGQPTFVQFNCTFQFLHTFNNWGQMICYAHGKVNPVANNSFIVTSLTGLSATGMASDCDPSTVGDVESGG